MGFGLLTTHSKTFCGAFYLQENIFVYSKILNDVLSVFSCCASFSIDNFDIFRDVNCSAIAFNKDNIHFVVLNFLCSHNWSKIL